MPVMMSATALLETSMPGLMRQFIMRMDNVRGRSKE